MLKRLLFVTLLTLPSCWPTSSPVTPSVTHCRAPKWPAVPVITPTACGEEVCLTIPDTEALASYLQAVNEVKRSLAGCNLIDWGA